MSKKNDAPTPGSNEWLAARTPEWREMNKVLSELQATNAQKMEAVQRSGARIDPSSMLFQRISMLTDFLLPMETEDRLRFELTFEQSLAEMLEKIEGEVRKARLLQGANMASPAAPQAGAQSPLILPGA